MQNSNDEDDDFVNGYLRKQHEQTFAPPQFTSNSQALTGFPQMPKIKHPLNTQSLNFSNTTENKYMTAYAKGFSPNDSINQPSQPSSTTSQNRSRSATEKEKQPPQGTQRSVSSKY
jgi:hypothetical protein